MSTILRSTSLSFALVAACYLVCGCQGSSGNLYFLSSQSLGLNVAASEPTNGGAPGLSIGYESVKGTVNPVKDDSGNMRSRAYSILGVTDARAGAGDRAKVGVSEWFAAGRAAEILAENPSTPAALTGNWALTKEGLASASGIEIANTFSALMSAEEWLSGLPSPSVRQVSILAELNQLESLAKAVAFKEYDPTTGQGSAYSHGGNGWDVVTSTLDDLEQESKDAIFWANNPTRTAPEKLRGIRDARKLDDQRNDLVKSILLEQAAKDAWAEYFTLFIRGG